MAVLKHDEQYPCKFELRLSEWERYNNDMGSFKGKTAGLGAPYTLWVRYRMALQIGYRTVYESRKDTTLVLEDIRRLIEELRQLTKDMKDRVAFDPIELDFGLIIRNLTESDSSVMISVKRGQTYFSLIGRFRLGMDWCRPLSG